MVGLVRWLGLGNQTTTKDPGTLALLQESKEVVVKVNKLMLEQDKTHRVQGKRMQKELVDLREAGTQLSDKVRKLEKDVSLSDKAKQALRSELAREQQQVSMMTERIHSQLREQQRLTGDLAVAHRERETLARSLASQKQLLQEQTSKAISATTLAGKYQERVTLEQGLKRVRSEIVSKSDKIGLRAGMIVGVLMGLFSGGIGSILWGLGAGGIVKSALQKMHIFSCTAALHAEKASLEKQLALVGGEIKRLASH